MRNRIMPNDTVKHRPSGEHNELVHLRGNMADLAGMAQRAKNSDEETKAMRLDVLMDSCISIGRLMGFLRREE